MVFALTGLAVALWVNAIFVGFGGLTTLVGPTLIAIGIGLAYRLADGRSHLLQIGLLVALTALIAFGLLREHEANGLSPLTAAQVTLPFCAFIAVAGSGAYELVFFHAIGFVTYLAGIWKTPQGPLFPLVLILGAAGLGLFLVLSVFRHDVLRYRRLHERCLAQGMAPPKVKGTFVLGGIASVTLLALGIMLVLAQGLFIAVPRPGSAVAAEEDGPSGGGTVDGGEGAPDADDPEPSDANSPEDAAIVTPGPDDTDDVSRDTGSMHRSGFANSVNLGTGRLILRDPRPMLRVGISLPGHPPGSFRQGVFYLRGTAFDHFDGRRWTISAAARREVETLRVEFLPPLWLPLMANLLEPEGDLAQRYPHPAAEELQRRLRPPGSPPPLREESLHDRRVCYSIGRLQDDGSVYFLPEFALDIDVTEGRYFPQVERLTPTGDAPEWYQTFGAGIRRHMWIVPDGAISVAPEGAVNSIPLSARDTVERHVVSAMRQWANPFNGQPPVTDLERVQAVIDYLSGPDSRFRYSLEIPPAPSGLDPVVFFLDHSRAGHCELFATAAALMLRAQDLGARVVGGYLGGDYNEEQRYYLVRALHAHLWVEVYFQGAGWIRFDPTPSEARDIVVGGLSRTDTGEDEVEEPAPEPVLEHGPGDDTTDTPEEAALTADGTDWFLGGPPPTQDPNLIARFSETDQAQLFGAFGWLTAMRDGEVDPIATGGLALMILGCVGFVALLATGIVARRLRAARARVESSAWRRRDAAATALPWVVDLDRTLQKAGLGRRTADTFLEHATAMPAMTDPRGARIAEHVQRLVDLYYQHRYAGRTLDAAEESEIRAWSRAIKLALREKPPVVAVPSPPSPSASA